MWAWVALIAGVVGILCLGIYLGDKLSTLTKELEERDEYVKKQAVILAAMVRAEKRAEDFAQFVGAVDAAESADELNKLYASLVPQTAVPNPGVLGKPSV